MAQSASIPQPSQVAGTETARTRLEPGRSAPALARRFTVDVLAGHGAGAELLDRAQLLVSELVTNAVVHARSPVWLSVTAADGAVRIQVEDRGGGRVARRQPGNLRGWNAGYGLWLVDSLAESWGVEHGSGHPAGPGEPPARQPGCGTPKTVWLRLPLAS